MPKEESLWLAYIALWTLGACFPSPFDSSGSSSSDPSAPDSLDIPGSCPLVPSGLVSLSLLGFFGSFSSDSCRFLYLFCNESDRSEVEDEDSRLLGPDRVPTGVHENVRKGAEVVDLRVRAGFFPFSILSCAGRGGSGGTTTSRSPPVSPKPPIYVDRKYFLIALHLDNLFSVLPAPPGPPRFTSSVDRRSLQLSTG